MIHITCLTLFTQIILHKVKHASEPSGPRRHKRTFVAGVGEGLRLDLPYFFRLWRKKRPGGLGGRRARPPSASNGGPAAASDLPWRPRQDLPYFFRLWRKKRPGGLGGEVMGVYAAASEGGLADTSFRNLIRFATRTRPVVN